MKPRWIGLSQIGPTWTLAELIPPRHGTKGPCHHRPQPPGIGYHCSHNLHYACSKLSCICACHGGEGKKAK